MSTGKYAKLSPRYCGPFTILERVGSLAYKLALLEGSLVHPVFHVSRLQKIVGEDKNIVSTDALVEFSEPPSIPHVPEKVLGFQNRHTRHMVYRECLVKWKDRHEEASTWEQVGNITKRYLNFVFEDENSFQGGGYCYVARNSSSRSSTGGVREPTRLAMTREPQPTRLGFIAKV